MAEDRVRRTVQLPNGMLVSLTQEEWELYKKPKTQEEIEEMRQRKDDFIHYLRKRIEERNK